MKYREFCKTYEEKIDKLGGIDIQVLGIGRTGHIGFNEPGSSERSLTRLVSLDQVTRIDAASDFFGEENVPRKAITMGVGSIMKAAKVYMMAWGEGKSAIIRKAVEGASHRSNTILISSKSSLIALWSWMMLHHRHSHESKPRGFSTASIGTKNLFAKPSSGYLKRLKSQS